MVGVGGPDVESRVLPLVVGSALVADRGTNSASSVDTTWTVISGKQPWLLGQSGLELAGCRFASSMIDDEGSFIIAPSGCAYPLARGFNLSLWLVGAVARSGEFVVGGVEGSPFAMMLDNGAAVNVASRGWEKVLTVLPGRGVDVAGVGGTVASVAKGSLSISFPPLSNTASPQLLHTVYGEFTVYVADGASSPSSSSPVVSLLDGLGSRACPWSSVYTAHASRFPPLDTPSLLVERLGIASSSVINRAHALYDGVRPMRALRSENLRDDPMWLAASRRRAVRSQRSQASKRHDASIALGERWDCDLTPKMPSPSFEGYLYALVCVEFCSGYLCVYPMDCKSAPHVVKALERLRVFVASNVPGRRLAEIRIDFDASLSVNGRGDDIDSAQLAAWRSRHPVRVLRSPPYTQALNRAESHMGRLFAQMAINATRAQVKDVAWWDMFSAAASQLNLHVLKGANVSVYERFWRRKPDISEWVASPGQWVFVTKPGTKANRFRDTAEPGWFVKPAECSGGFLVRLFRTLNSTHVYNVHVINDRHLRVARMQAGDAFTRTPQLRSLFRSPGSLDSAADSDVVVLDPVTGEPVQLLPGFDAEGALTMLPQSHWDSRGVIVSDDAAAGGDGVSSSIRGVENSSAGSADEGVRTIDDGDDDAGNDIMTDDADTTATATDDDAKDRKNDDLWQRTPRRPLVPMSLLKTLPNRTEIRVHPTYAKSGASGRRWSLYRNSCTIGALKDSNSRHFTADLQYDVSRGLIKIAGLSFDESKSEYTFAPVMSARCYAATMGDGSLDDMLGEAFITPPFAEAEFIPGIRERLLQAEEHAHAESREALGRLAELDETLRSLIELEGLEGEAGAPSMSDASAVAMADACLDQWYLSRGYESADFSQTTTSEEGGCEVFTVKGSNDHFQGLRQAKASAEWLIPGGWKEAVQRDLSQGERRKAWSVVPRSRYYESIAKYGRDRVDKKHLAFDFKEKTTVQDKKMTRRKARVCVADRVQDGKVPDTFSPTVAPSSRKLMAQLLALLPGATSDQNDVEGAYYNGTPVHPDDGGRVLFCEIPAELMEFGYEVWAEDGSRNLLEITGNVPGRQEAGKIWGDEYAKFFCECGMTQSVVDRRIFFRREDKLRIMIVAVYVDDSWRVCTCPKLRAELNEKWKQRFSLAADVEETEGDFCGTHITQHADGSVELTGGRLYQDLELKLQDHPLPHGYTVAYPMSHDALNALRSAPSDSNPLQDSTLQSAARSILGLGGFIVCNLRPDGYFAFVVLTQHIAHHFTLAVWKALLRWAYYLIDTQQLRLTYHPSSEWSWCLHSDSAFSNAMEGGSFGGFTFRLEGDSALIDWRCLVPRVFTDSSAAAELTIAAMAVKSALGYRILLNQLGLLQPEPTVVYLDAKAVINGAEMERVTREMRFMAVRYSMLRQAVVDGKVTLGKVDSELNEADGFTKPLVGPNFEKWRALVLGLSSPST